AHSLLGKAIRSMFVQYFPDPQSFKKTAKKAEGPKANNPYQPVIDWFGKGNNLLIPVDAGEDLYRNSLYKVDGLYSVVKQYYPKADEVQAALLMEFLLHGLAEYSLISKKGVEAGGYNFSDILGGMLNMSFGNEEDSEEY
ncbi:MAG: magnesium chelatase, partial [Taibaiella sp.]|nr:magnesium chelatase [Taibaiella sp.]